MAGGRWAQIVVADDGPGIPPTNVVGSSSASPAWTTVADDDQVEPASVSPSSPRLYTLTTEQSRSVTARPGLGWSLAPLRRG